MKGKTTKRHDRRRELATALILGAIGAVAAKPAPAQELQQVSVDERVQFDIAAQPLSGALSEFARQARVNALYFSDDLRGLTSPPLQGAFTRQEALDRLLARSRYSGHITGTNLVLVENDPALPQRGSAASSAVERGALADAGRPDENPHEEEIVVTGTRIRGAPPAGSNVLTLDREAIDALGRSTVQDVIQSLPQNFAGSQNEATQLGTRDARSNLTFSSTVDLRGLGADATLTLVNGRRLAPAGFGNFVDISTIPLSAVERIEVLADGASAIYGSDAVGGVVNIILDRDFEGAETSLRLGGAAQGGAEDFGFSQLGGVSTPSAHVTFGYEYRNRGDVDTRYREFTESADFRARGGSNFNRIQSNPGNITRIGATTVSLAIPRNQDGTSLSQAELVAGNPNFGEINQGAWLVPQQTTHAAFVSANKRFGELEIFGDFLAGYRHAYMERAQLPTNLVVPQSNYYRTLNNLFPGQGNLTIAYHMGADLGPITSETLTRAYSGVGGLAYSWGDWRAEASFAIAASREAIDTRNFYDSANNTVHLASNNPATAFNPFGDGSHTPASVLAGLTFDQFTRNDAQTETFSIRADGPLFSIWGGPVRAAIGAESRHEQFEITRFEDHRSGLSVRPTIAPGERDVDAIFAELNVPLVGESNNVPLIEQLTLSLSARREEASDYGEATTPKVGMTWDIISGLTLRGTWGRSFKGPQLEQLLGGTGLSYLTATPAQDPLADNGATGVLVLAGSNPNLEPERAESWTAGFDYAPIWLEGARISATYFDIDFADRISSAGSATSILRNPAGLESIVFRDPTPQLLAYYLSLGPAPTGVLPAEGVEVIIDTRAVNLSTQRVRGVDFGANVAFETDLGNFNLFATSSILLQHEFSLSPGAAPVDQLDTLNNPIDWRLRAGVSYARDRWNAGLSASYSDNYTDNISLPVRKIDAYTIWDFRLAYDWRTEGSERGALIALNVANLFDDDPPFVNNVTGFAYDASNASPYGRVISLELRQSW
jgi:outer membrane receptor protein involved in Fe transport